ncbi:MAG: PIN domain-containing protein [Rubrivivax sp.]
MPASRPFSAAPAVVLDTNVVFDWLVFGNPAVAPVIEGIRTGRLRWLACAAMRDEAAWTLAHGSLATRVASLEQALTSFDTLVTWVDAPPTPAAPRLRCSDASDQMFVDLALQHRARWLLTRDRALLKLARRARAHGLAINAPERWTAPA